MTTTSSPDLVDAPAWSIRPELPVDLDLIHDLHRAAFPGPAEAELVDAIRSSANFVPELSLVAVADDGSILGHVLLSTIAFQPDADAEQRSEVLALAPIAVLPAHQGRGIGSALMREALAMADEREEPFVVVVGAQTFYEAFGFGPASAHEIRGPYDGAGPSFQVRARPGTDLEPGAVSYPAAFSEV